MAKNKLSIFIFKTFHFLTLITLKIEPPKLPTRATPQKSHIFIKLNYFNMTKILYSCKRSLNIIITLKLPSQSYYYSHLPMVEKKIYCKINMQNDATPTKVKLLLFSFYVPPAEKLLSSNYFRNCSCSVCACWLRMRQRRLTSDGFGLTAAATRNRTLHTTRLLPLVCLLYFPLLFPP